MIQQSTISSESSPVDSGQLDALRGYPSPTIANAVEVAVGRHRAHGCTGPGIRCLYPGLGPVVGFACTATILSGQPAGAERRVCRTAYWEYTRSVASPKITVVQDLSPKPGGAYLGEVNASIHLALGSQGVITNGTVRDLDEVRALNFHFFSSGVEVSHGYAHLEDFNRPVTVFGMTIQPGDLIHADFHGAVVVPPDAIGEVLDAAKEIMRKEERMSRVPVPGFFD